MGHFMVLSWLRIHHDSIKHFEVLEWFWRVAFLAHHLLKHNEVPKSRYLQVDSFLSWEFIPKKESQGQVGLLNYNTLSL